MLFADTVPRLDAAVKALPSALPCKMCPCRQATASVGIRNWFLSHSRDSVDGLVRVPPKKRHLRVLRQHPARQILGITIKCASDGHNTGAEVFRTLARTDDDEEKKTNGEVGGRLAKGVDLRNQFTHTKKIAETIGNEANSATCGAERTCLLVSHERAGFNSSSRRLCAFAVERDRLHSECRGIKIRTIPTYSFRGHTG